MALRLIRRAGANLPLDKELFLSLLNGLESGIATTTAIVVGLTITERPVNVVLTAAIVTIAVQAFNSAAARYTVMRASEEIDDQNATERFGPLVNASAQFISHATASIIPILPLFVSTNDLVIVISSILLAYCMMVIIGGFQGLFLNIQAKQNMIELLLTGTLVIAIGTIAGFALK